MMNGTDFIADDYSDRLHRGRRGFFVNDANTRTTRLGYVSNNDRATNFEYDGVNIYGDDFNNGGAFDFAANYSNPDLAGKRVTRTGYTEYDLIGNQGKVFSTRASASVHYIVAKNMELIGGLYYGNGNFIRTAGFREYFPDYRRTQIKLELKGDNFFLRGYTTNQNAEGYNLGNLAARLLTKAKSTANWATDFATRFNQTGSLLGARTYADELGRFQVGSTNYIRIREELISTPNNRAIPSTGVNGVRLLDNSSMMHFEGMYNFNKLLPENIEVITGASYRLFDMDTKGTIFPLTNDGKEFSFSEVGAYLQASYILKLGEKTTFKPTAAVRYDKNEFFQGGFTPRISGVLSIGEHNFRGSWQSAFRNPSANQILADGKIGEVGGSQAAADAAGLFTNPAYTEASVRLFQTSGNASDLVKYTPAPEKFTTEKIKTWEIGYKTLVDNKLFIDAFYFGSTYTDFIATQNYNQLVGDKVGDINNFRTASNYRTLQINFNNFNEIFVSGYGFGLEYGMGKGYTISGNFANQVGKITLRNAAGTIIKDPFGQDIVERKMSDPEVAAVQRNFFISPENRYNITFANARLTKSLGFAVTYRWTDTMWVEQGTTQGDIWLPSWNTVDAQLSIKMPSVKSILKIGATNMFNNYYSQGYGLAQIGGLYYVSLNFDQLMR
jgi:hypothetical protein